MVIKEEGTVLLLSGINSGEMEGCVLTINIEILYDSKCGLDVPAKICFNSMLYVIGLVVCKYVHIGGPAGVEKSVQ
jgi:hypothetical protein